VIPILGPKSDRSISLAPYIRTRISTKLSPQNVVHTFLRSPPTVIQTTLLITLLLHIFPLTFSSLNSNLIRYKTIGWSISVTHRSPMKSNYFWQLGGNFGLPLMSTNHNKMTINFIKHIEKT